MSVICQHSDFTKILDKSIVYSLDFTNVSEGTIPVGWQATQGGDEVHEYLNSYSSGARTFTGFGGWQGRGFSPLSYLKFIPDCIGSSGFLYRNFTLRKEKNTFFFR